QREASLLESTRKERDLYAGFAAEMSSLLTTQELAGERAALVLLGGARDALEPVKALLEEAGAGVTRRVHIGEAWADSPQRFASILTFAESAGTPDEPGLLLAEVVAAPHSQVFTTIEAPSLWFEALDGDAPTLAVFVLPGAPSEFASLFTSTA